MKCLLSLYQETQMVWGFQNYIVRAMSRCRTVQAYLKLESRPPKRNLRQLQFASDVRTEGRGDPVIQNDTGDVRTYTR